MILFLFLIVFRRSLLILFIFSRFILFRILCLQKCTSFDTRKAKISLRIVRRNACRWDYHVSLSFTIQIFQRTSSRIKLWYGTLILLRLQISLFYYIHNWISWFFKWEKFNSWVSRYQGSQILLRKGIFEICLKGC